MRSRTIRASPTPSRLFKCYNLIPPSAWSPRSLPLGVAALGVRHKMKTWPDRLRLLSILATTKILLAHSPEEGWGFEYPKETEENIDQIIDCIFFPNNKPLPNYWELLFAPTGPIQEISMANGWSELYLKISKEFDSLEYILKDYEKKCRTSQSS